jgi:hypothetical protein
MLVSGAVGYSSYENFVCACSRKFCRCSWLARIFLVHKMAGVESVGSGGKFGEKKVYKEIENI